MNRRFLGLALCLVLGACKTDIQSGIDSANDLLFREQYVEAERLYRKLLKRLGGEKSSLSEDEDAERLLILDRLGKINSLYLHNYTQAIADYQALVSNYPKTDQALAARAMVADLYHHKLGDLQSAIDEYQKLVAEFSSNEEAKRAQLQIATAYFQLKNFEQARGEAEVVVNRWPNAPEAAQARFQIANSYYVQGRYQEAVATYEGLMEKNPDKGLSSLVLFELGNSFQELGEVDRALAYYYACLSDHPDPVLVQRKISRVRERAYRAGPRAVLDLPSYVQDRLARSGAVVSDASHTQKKEKILSAPTVTESGVGVIDSDVPPESRPKKKRAPTPEGATPATETPAAATDAPPSPVPAAAPAPGPDKVPTPATVQEPAVVSPNPSTP